MKKIGVIFGFISILMLSLAAYLYISTASLKSHGASTEGTVVEMITKNGDSNSNDTYSPVVEYKVNGQDLRYTSSTSSNPPAFSVGEKVKMIYDPADPSSAKIDSFFSLWFGTILTGAFGLMFSIPAVIIFLLSSRRKKLEEYFLTHGQTMNLKISKVGLDTSLEVNGRNPYRIYAEWLDQSKNELHVYKSSHIWFDPTPYIQGENINVKVDINNPKKYLMDTSFLPKKV